MGAVGYQILLLSLFKCFCYESSTLSSPGALSLWRAHVYYCQYISNKALVFCKNCSDSKSLSILQMRASFGV